MKQWFEKMGRKMQQWMVGRYGTDELSRCLVWVGIGIMIISCFIQQTTVKSILYFISWIIIIYSYYRTFSKNIIKRSKERDNYLRFTSGFRGKFSVLKKRWRDRKTHNYYRCPKCKTYIRVPKGKGKIAITCPKCRNEIIKTT